MRAINARIRFIRRLQIERPPHGKVQFDAHTAFAQAAMERNAETGMARLQDHIAISVTAAQTAIKDVLMQTELLPVSWTGG